MNLYIFFRVILIEIDFQNELGVINASIDISPHPITQVAINLFIYLFTLLKYKRTQGRLDLDITARR